MRAYILFIVPLLVFNLVSQATVANAATKELSEEEQKAIRAYDRGIAHFEAGKYIPAAENFKAAYRLFPEKWQVLYNIGQCEISAKRYGIAFEALEQYLVKAGDEITPARQQEVKDELERLEGLVGFLKIEGPKDTIIYVNEVKRGTLPLPGELPVTASKVHFIRGEHNDHPLEEATIKVSNGRRETVTLEIRVPQTSGSNETKVVMVESSSDDAASPKNPLKIAGLALTGTGAAALIAGTITGAMTLKQNTKLKDACLEEASGCVVLNEDKDIYNKRNTLGITTNILLFGGAALATTGVVLLIVSRKKEKLNNAYILPAVGPQMVAGTIGWRF